MALAIAARPTTVGTANGPRERNRLAESIGSNATRTYCRNPRCRAQLAEPADHPQRAFCCRGCRESFYLRRCLVCERPLAHERLKTCGRKCRAIYRRFPHRCQQAKGRVAKRVNLASEVPVKRASKSPISATERQARAARAAASAQAIFQPAVPPLNLLGGFRFPEIAAHKLVRAMLAAPALSAPPLPDPGGDPLEIPPFLRRAP